ncbi:MAG: hypothetical protein LJE57_02395 [Gallionella sp.]|nr:hypothetical protein [Gallionella sp.]
MYPVHDVDALLLLSLSVASKRRPADLLEVITAIDLAQGTIPSANKLSDAFARLSAYGLIVEINGGYTLSADAQQMMENQRKNDDTAKKIYRLKEHLADYRLNGEHAAILVHPDQLLAALQAFRKARGSGRSWLIDKPKPAWIPTRELVRTGKPFPHKRRKT